MIQAIKELNFPPYATLSQATATMHDMGDRTITADIKIDGAITPDFSYDWEVEFKGDKYIQPLRKPQGSKGDKSSMSTINLTFYHWAIYQLKRYFFVELASTQAGTAFADKYIVPLSVNLGEFVVAFSNVLSYYFPDGDIYIDLNPDWVFDAERKYIDINNTYLWNVLQKTHELFGVRWVIERDTNGKYAIRIGYPAGELTHIFEYGFEGGLLKVERQVQDTNIRNKILGRGGSRNLPYLYFKDYDKYPFGGDGNQGMTPDPDAIPELSNIFFSELRDSNFRSYVQGWKTNVNRQLVAGDTLNAFDAERAKTDYAYMRGATDEKFDPVEFVKDDASIEEYGELVGKLENNEEIFPSLQGMEVEIAAPGGNTFTTRADEIVAVQEVATDRIASDEVEVKNDIKLEAKSETSHDAGSNTFVATESTITVSSNEVVVPDGYEGTLFDVPTIKYTLEWKERIKQYMQYKQYYEGDKLSGNVYSKGDDAFPSVSYKVIDVISGKEVHPVNLPEGRYRVDYTLKFPAVTLGRGIIHAQQTPNGLGQTERVSVYWLKRIVKTSAAIICKSFNGDVILNKVDGVSISKSVSVAANAKTTISISGDTFTVPAQGAMMVDVPISVTPAATTTYSEKTVKVVNAKTNEIVPAINIPEGEYKLLVDVTLTNESSSAKDLKVELLPAYLYFVDNTEKWEPTFDVWIKNVFNTKKSDYASEAAYVEGVWSPLRTEDDMAITFSSGNLSGHDSWEFRIKKGGIAYDNSKVITDSDGNEVRSEWRLTLIKSDAELETIKKYIPYKDFNAKAGDFFFFTGIYLPHQYVLSAEKKLTQYKEDNLSEVSDIKPQWVISLDKVRAHRGDADRLVDALSVGSAITLKDKRFTKSFGEKQILQSITYEWQESALLPTIDVVLSDKVTTTLSTVAMLQGKVDALAKQVGGLSNLEQIIRKVGDLLYLRKDGFEDTSFSPTKFSDQVKFGKTVSSENFKPGAVGGTGWAAYQDENGNSVIEADKLFVRNDIQVNNLVINQVTALGGTKIMSAADMTISAIETVVLENDVIGERCFFETKGASKANLFAVNDIAYSNRFDAENEELKYYKRRVIEVGENYITLSTTDKDGDGSPQVGDVIVHFGNFTNKDRQSFIVIDPMKGGKIEVFAGVDSFDITDCNMIGMGVDPNTNESFLYGYGDMFFGDKTKSGHYISFDKSTGKFQIKADVTFESGSSGLSNIPEWLTVQQSAENAERTAKKKSQTFTSQPTPPYKKGDLWSQGDDAPLMVCVASKESGKFSAEDWAVADNSQAYTDAAISDLNIGGENMLRNSGFTGDYLSERVADDSVLTSNSQLYSPPLDHWDDGVAVSVLALADESASGYGVGLNGDSLGQELFNNIVAGESYVVSFKAMASNGADVSVSLGGTTKTINIKNEWDRYIVEIVPAAAKSYFSISGNAIICEIKLEKGNKATAWSTSPLDNRSDRAYYQSLKYLQNAFESITEVLGGLVLTEQVHVGHYDKENKKWVRETGGMSGTYESDEDVAFWAGGSFNQAIETVMRYADDPSYQPTEEELASMAKYVVTHGGRAILNEAIVRGAIYATKGHFGDLTIISDAVYGDAGLEGTKVYDVTEKHVLRLFSDYFEMLGYESDRLIESIRISPYVFSDRHDMSGIIDLYARKGGAAINVDQGQIRGLRHDVLATTSDQITLYGWSPYVIILKNATTSNKSIVLPQDPETGTTFRIINTHGSAIIIGTGANGDSNVINIETGETSNGAGWNGATNPRVFEVYFDGSSWYVCPTKS